MAAKIRLKKVGRKGQPSYRVVVLDGRKPRDAKVVADLGHYDPKTNPPSFEIDRELALKWLLDGAKATSAARDILSKAGVMQAWDATRRGEVVTEFPEKKEEKPTEKKPSKKAEAAAEKKAEVEAEAEAEAPAASDEAASDEAGAEEPAAEAVEEPAAEAEEEASSDEASSDEEEEEEKAAE